MNKCSIKYITTEQTHDEWVEARKEGIGGSDAGVIVGASRYASPFSLYHEKRGSVVSDFTGNESTRWGNRLERSIAEEYAETYNASVVAYPVTLVSNEREWQVANVDFFIMRHDHNGLYPAGKVTDIEASRLNLERLHTPEAILEIKTNGLVSRASSDWDDDNYPETYAYQTMHYCAVTGLRKAVLAALVGGRGLQVRDLEFSEEEIEALNGHEAKFWQMVQEGVEPEASGLVSDFDTLKSLYPESVGETVEVTEFTADIVREYAEAKYELDKAESKAKALRAQIEQAIGDAEAITYNGSTLCTFKSTKSGEAIDTKALEAELPEVAAKYKKVKPGYRVLRLKEQP
jgi:putative phage-type endonuclease